MQSKCLGTEDPRNQWAQEFCPSFPLAIIFSILFGASTAFHIYQARRYRNNYCWVLIMFGLWETASFIARTISIQNPTWPGAFDPNFILFLLAPLWLNAFDYMLFGLMVHHFLPDKRLFGIPAQKMTLCFVALDLTSFGIQIGGGLMILSQNLVEMERGLNVYTAGACLQEFFILCFLFLVLTFQRRLSKECNSWEQQQAKALLWTTYLTLGLIAFRICFRVVEFSAGGKSNLTHQIRGHEWYQYAFDAVPMFLALLTVNILHPGMTLYGEQSKFLKLNDVEMVMEREHKKKERERNSIYGSSYDSQDVEGYEKWLHHWLTSIQDQKDAETKYSRFFG